MLIGKCEQSCMHDANWPPLKLYILAAVSWKSGLEDVAVYTRALRSCARGAGVPALKDDAIRQLLPSLSALDGSSLAM